MALDVGSILLHPQLKYNASQFARTLGPAAIGLTFGATIGGGMLSLPSCDPNWAPGAPPEGDARARWPVALALAGVSAAVAPLVTGIVTGGLDRTWTFTERSSRMWVAAGSGFVGALLPYIPALSPKTLRAARELERLRIEPTVGGVAAGYTLRF